MAPELGRLAGGWVHAIVKGDYLCEQTDAGSHRRDAASREYAVESAGCAILAVLTLGGIIHATQATARKAAGADPVPFT